MSFAENEVLSTWCKASYNQTKLIPRTPGVYALVSLGNFLYVGTSRCIRTRIFSFGDHPIVSLLPSRKFKSYADIRDYLAAEFSLEVYWLSLNPDNKLLRHKLETQLIRDIKPSLNVLMVKG